MTKSNLSISEMTWDARDCGLVTGTAPKKRGKGSRRDDNASQRGQVTKSAVMFVLWALIHRCNPRHQYSTFVSEATLADDTGLSVATVKRALHHLTETVKLVRCVPRSFKSNFYYIDAKTMHDAAERNRSEARALKDHAKSRPSSPFKQPTFQPTEDDAPDAGASSVDSVPQKAADRTIVDEILLLLEQHFGNHPTYERSDSGAIMRGCVQKCLDYADANCSRDHDLTTLEVFRWLIAQDDICEKIRSSKRLGGFLGDRFPTWTLKWHSSVNMEDSEEGERQDVDVDDYEPTEALAL